MSGEAKRRYRSAEWFGKPDKDGFGHRSWMRNQGLPGDVFDVLWRANRKNIALLEEHLRSEGILMEEPFIEV